MEKITIDLPAYHPCSRSTESKSYSIGALIATILMAGGCIAYISLCIFLCVYRSCFHSESAEPENEICERNFVIGAKLKTKVCVNFKQISLSFVVTHDSSAYSVIGVKIAKGLECSSTQVEESKDQKNVYHQKEESKIETCPICCEDFRIGDSVSFGFCRHVYHFDCIQKWLENHETCCYCRENIVVLNVQNSNHTGDDALNMKCDADGVDFCIFHGLVDRNSRKIQNCNLNADDADMV